MKKITNRQRTYVWVIGLAIATTCGLLPSVAGAEGLCGSDASVVGVGRHSVANIENNTICGLTTAETPLGCTKLSNTKFRQDFFNRISTGVLRMRVISTSDLVANITATVGGKSCSRQITATNTERCRIYNVAVSPSAIVFEISDPSAVAEFRFDWCDQ